jgi:hypothetical protein
MDEDGDVDSKQLRRQVRKGCNVSWIYDGLSCNVHVYLKVHCTYSCGQALKVMTFAPCTLACCFDFHSQETLCGILSKALLKKDAVDEVTRTREQW